MHEEEIYSYAEARLMNKSYENGIWMHKGRLVSD